MKIETTPIEKLIPYALHHPLAGPEPLSSHERLRKIKLSNTEIELVREVSAAIDKLTSQAAAYGATKLRDELEAAKREIAEKLLGICFFT
jgi:hypothetical protein